MNIGTTTAHRQASHQDTVSPLRLRRTWAFKLGDMTRLIITAIVAALTAGLLLLPVTMPGTALHSARADLPALEVPTTLVKGPASFRA
ncbi:hypothetical protein SAMN05444414_1467 [Roseovarius marisflavi]|uniref:Uncharacterized protein n=1 Tax=Roseovarius marisflavi TaxID=1054996 RepID=A0A1M7DPI6_9RHOB|nr:hypothetical protein SAMN05444414_1467 [Roseovarius marisflavi]